jgi:hypothetical protein
MHETKDTTVAALPKILAAAKQKGLRLVSIPQLLALDELSRRRGRVILFDAGGLADHRLGLEVHPRGEAGDHLTALREERELDAVDLSPRLSPRTTVVARFPGLG